MTTERDESLQNLRSFYTIRAFRNYFCKCGLFLKSRVTRISTWAAVTEMSCRPFCHVVFTLIREVDGADLVSKSAGSPPTLNEGYENQEKAQKCRSGLRHCVRLRHSEESKNPIVDSTPGKTRNREEKEKKTTGRRKPLEWIGILYELQGSLLYRPHQIVNGLFLYLRLNQHLLNVLG